MDVLQTILLHTMWMVHLFFQRLLSNRSDVSRTTETTTLPIVKIVAETKGYKKGAIMHSTTSTPTVPASRDIIDDFKTKATGRKFTQPLLFNAKSKSLVDLSDLVSPLEEEMLRCLCAKGYDGMQPEAHAGSGMTRRERRQHRYRGSLPTRYQQQKQQQHSCAQPMTSIPRDIFTNVWLNHSSMDLRRCDSRAGDDSLQ